MEKIRKYIKEYEIPKRKAISNRFPFLVSPAVFTKRTIRNIKNKISLPRLYKGELLANIIARHSSPLYRKLEDVDFDLQKNKVTNLEIAISALDELVIPPGKTFSFWNVVGSVSKKKGYVDGMLLSNGKISRGVGGGLCQLSNFLMWIFLHSDIEIVERHHHSVDSFPDSGRTLPFGSGATIFNNYLDLKIKNVSNSSLQLKLWLTDDYLKGQLLSDKPSENKYHILEKEHCFISQKGDFFRYNEIHRETYKQGVKIGEEIIFTNFAPVAYDVEESRLKEFGYKIISF